MIKFYDTNTVCTLYKVIVIIGTENHNHPENEQKKLYAIAENAVYNKPPCFPKVVQMPAIILLFYM